MTETLEQILTAYDVWLDRQPLAAKTRTAYRLQVHQFGVDAHLELSAHVLRHTCLTNLVRCGYDLVLVAEIAGHKRLETTLRYSLPSLEDRESAMEALHIEY